MLLSVWAGAPQSWTELLALATHAEATGWHGLWVPDMAGQRLDAWAALGGLATRLPRVRLGTLVSNPADRHPAVVAKLAVTLDHLSAGRTVLGLGTGWGAPRGTRRERWDLLDEACRVVKSLLGNSHTTFDGEHFRLQDAPLEPKPVQDPLPLVVGGVSGGALQIAARWADGWNGWGDPSSVASRASALDECCTSIGRDPATLRRSALALVAAERPATDLPFPVVHPSQLGGYEDAGVDELVIADLLLGTGSGKLAALDEIQRVCCS